MPTYPVVNVGTDWSLIYDPTVSGDFAGGIARNGGSVVLVQVAATTPLATTGGFQLQATLPVSLSAASGVKLYGRALSDFALVQMVDELYPDSFPPGVFTGTRAITVQPYTEANVKNGTEFYLRVSYPTADPVVQGTSRKIFFQTGAKKVVIKLRDVAYVGEELSINLFSAPTGVAGGTPIPVRNYNRVNPVATTVTATRDVTTTSDGTLFDGPEYLFGSSNAPQRNPVSIPAGRERILAPNSSFLVVISAPAGVGNSRAQYFLDWYEGDTDIPAPL
jgi:hypothetical protein